MLTTIMEKIKKESSQADAWAVVEITKLTCDGEFHDWKIGETIILNYCFARELEALENNLRENVPPEVKIVDLDKRGDTYFIGLWAGKEREVSLNITLDGEIVVK